MTGLSTPVAPPSRVTTSRLPTCRYSSNLTWSWPPSASPNSHNHGILVHVSVHSISASKCISSLARSLPPSVSLSSLNPGFQVRLHTWSITTPKCISEFTWSRPPCESPHSLAPSLQVYLQSCSTTFRKYILKEWRRVYRNTGVWVVDRVTEIMYLANSGVDRLYLISISSYHTMTIHTLSFPTFGLTCSVRDIMDPCHCMDPQRRVVLYLLTWLLRTTKQHRSFWSILFGCCETRGGMLMVGSLPSSSIVLPQQPPSGASQKSQWACPAAAPIVRIYHQRLDSPYVTLHRNLNNACHNMMLRILWL